jgi:alpha-tubulin suppressor-like RCC1 family protein
VVAALMSCGLGRSCTVVCREQSPRDGAPFVDVACGNSHVVALTASKRVFSWGLNSKGQLGVGDTKTRYKPTQVGDGCHTHRACVDAHCACLPVVSVIVRAL